jgi:hypothetical protein
MTTKTNKAKDVKTLLRRGLSTKQITNLMAVSPGYVWLLKKQMAEEKAEENDDNVVRPRYVSKHPPMMRRVTKEHAEHLMELNPKERAEQIKELDRDRPAYFRNAEATLTERDYPEAKSELANMSPEEHLELLHSLSSGKGKERVAPKVDKVDATLTERGEDYGNYANKAVFIQEVKYLMRSGPSWDTMDPDMRESMEMIAHKMGRIAYGDPSHLDSWIDIAGYAKLVSDRLQGNAR